MSQRIFFKVLFSWMVLMNALVSIKAINQDVFVNVGKSIVTGEVVDESGVPIVGATIVVQGNASVGTVTDIDGVFKLETSESKLSLVISFIGYKTQEIEAYPGKLLKVVMTPDVELLDEVVVIGYGTVKKKDLTGAVSSVDVKDMPVNTVSTIGHALAGKAAGLRVSQSSAQVGGGVSFKIRGEASTGAGNEPLIVIDGFPINPGWDADSGNRYNAGSTDNLLGSLNPDDIASIEVLKDASSTAIYGARAGHGVILVTTKRGSERKPEVTYSMNVSFQNMKNPYKLLNAPQFYSARNNLLEELWKRDNGLDIYKDYISLEPGHQVSPFDPPYTDSDIRDAVTTDWFDEITRSGFMQQHNVSITGGTKSTQYMMSLGYMGQDGVIKNNAMERISARVNLDQKISDYVKAGLTLNITRNNYDNVPLGDGQYENAGIIGSSVVFNPAVSVYDENGKYNYDPLNRQIPNPVSLLEITDKTRKDRVLGNVFLEIYPLKGLTLKANMGADVRYQNRNNYLPKTTMYGEKENGKAYVRKENFSDYLMEFTANYSKQIKQHSFNALLGYSFQKFTNEGASAGNSDFLTDSYLYNNLGAGNYARPSVNSWGSTSSMGSYFARINYSFLDRYLLTATFRADGASNLAKGNQWGYFPSISLAWRFSEEKFVKAFAPFLSNGKLRISYGQTGNSNVGNKAIDLFGTGYTTIFGGVPYMGVYATQLGNKNLTWETTSEYNLGLDLGFCENRFNITLEYFNRIISDLLVSWKNLPNYNEINGLAANIGKTKSQGFEMTVNTTNVTTKDFDWTTDFTLSFYRDRWKERDPNWAPAAYEKQDDYIRSWFDFASDGLLQPGETAPEHQPGLLPGQVKLKDLSGNGTLGDEDKIFIGSSDPKIIYGLNNTFRYKRFDFNCYFYGEAGMTRGASYYEGWATWGLQGGQNVSTAYFDCFSSTNQSGTLPSVISSNWGYGDFYARKVYYIRCRNLTLGYTIPINKKVLNNVRVYADVNNPFVITNWNGVDPETDNGNYNYPNVMSFNLGCSITF